MKKIKEELYEYMEKHSNSEQSAQEQQDAKFEKLKQELLQKAYEDELKMKKELIFYTEVMKNIIKNFRIETIRNLMAV